MVKFVLPRPTACFLMLISVAAQAAPARQMPPGAPLTLAAAQAKVMQHNAALRALAHEVSAQDGMVRQAGAMPNPELSALVEDRHSATRSTTIQLTQPVELGGKRGARVNAAEAERELARATLAAMRSDLRANTSTAFYNVLAAQAKLDLTDATVALATQGLSAAATTVAAGKNSPVDETRARIAMSGAEIELAQARGDTDHAREALASLWGGSGEELGQVEGNLSNLPESASLPVLLARLERAPGVARARLELQRRVALGRVESARRMPDLAITVGSKNDEQFGRRQAVFGVSLPLPLFDRNQGRVDETAQRIEQARAELAAASASLASALRSAHRRLTVACSQANSLETGHIPAARSVYEATRKGYEYGKFGILDVFEVQRVLLQAQAQHVRVLADAYSAAADIERILGAPGTVQLQETP